MTNRYDGNDPGDWASCVWIPPHILDKVIEQKIELLKQMSAAMIAQHNGPAAFKTYKGKQITAEQRRQLHIRGYL